MEAQEPNYRQRYGSYPGPSSTSLRMQHPESVSHAYALPPPNPPFTHTPNSIPPSPYESIPSTAQPPPESRALPDPAHAYPSAGPAFSTAPRQPHSYSTPHPSATAAAPPPPLSVSAQAQAQAPPPTPENVFARTGSVPAPPRISGDAQIPQFVRQLNGASISPDQRQIPAGEFRSPHGYSLYEVMPAGPSPGPPGHYSAPPPTPVTHPGPHFEPNGIYHHQQQQQQQSQQQQQQQHPIIAAPYPPQRRRPVRAAQACENCRQRKAKCDEQRPCSSCKEAQQQCVYRDVPPAKQEKTQQAILEKLDSLGSQIKTVVERCERMEKIIMQNKTNSSILNTAAATQASVETSYQSTQIPTPNMAVSHETDGSLNQTVQSQTDSTPPLIQPLERRTGTASDLVTIPANHTTAAQKLLRWPQIKELVPKTISEDYVMKCEMERGVLRVFGRGEGRPIIPSPNSASGVMPGGIDNVVKSEEIPLSPTGLWGTDFISHASVDLSSKEVSINNDGTLRLDLHTIHRFTESYKQNIHSLHPILDLKSLEKSMAQFKKKYNPPADPIGRTGRSSFAVGSFSSAGSPKDYGSISRPAKRKRSSEDLQSNDSNNTVVINGASVHTLQMLEMSINTAIILLVLALGQICECKDKLPGPLPDVPRVDTPSERSDSPLQAPDTVASPQPNTKQSPASISSPLTTMAASPLPNNLRVGNTPVAIPRRSTFEHRDGPQRNIEVIPGLGYYACSTKILGALHGGFDLSFIQAYLLAGLYAGQLARVIESWSWINLACRSCHFMIRELPNEKDQFRKDLMHLNYWSCLQLESDILAEMDLPSSGITQYEESLPFPTGFRSVNIAPDMDLTDNGVMTMSHYSAQISLRKLLNTIHATLYKSDDKSKVKEWSSDTSEYLSDWLERWRASLPVTLQWRDEQLPADNINDARLRGKYYGAKYIIHRPFLHHALQKKWADIRDESPYFSPNPSSSGPSPNVSDALPNKSQSRSSSSDRKPVIGDAIPEKALEACKQCVEAAYRSTVAFDGVRTTIGETRAWSRPIITNIFGTAHAQFGNMLVLSATHRSHLHYLVPKEKLNPLLSRTIHFLRASAKISPTLRKDAEILEHIQDRVFGWAPDNSLVSQTLSSSFYM